MPTPADLAKLSVRDFAKLFRQEMVPLGNRFSYFSVLPLAEDDVKEYLEDPIAALPPALQEGLTRVSILFVPYLEKHGRRSRNRDFRTPG